MKQAAMRVVFVIGALFLAGLMAAAVIGWALQGWVVRKARSRPRMPKR